MKIDINTLQGSGSQAREVATRGSDRASRSSESTAANRTVDDRASVSLSDDARLLTDLQGTVARQPEINQAKVEDIRSRIENGTYHVDPERLASSFLELESVLNQ